MIRTRSSSKCGYCLLSLVLVAPLCGCDLRAGREFRVKDSFEGTSMVGVELGMVGDLSSRAFGLALCTSASGSAKTPILLVGWISTTNQALHFKNLSVKCDGTLLRLPGSSGNFDVSVSQYSTQYRERFQSAVTEEQLQTMAEAKSITFRFYGHEVYCGDYALTEKQVKAVREFHERFVRGRTVSTGRPETN